MDGGYARPSVVDAALAVVLVPLAAAAWAALAAAHFGRLSLVAPAVAGAVALAAVVVALGRLAATGRLRIDRLDVATVAVAVLAVARLGPAVSPWPAFLDASWYLNAGAAIAANGSLLVPASALEVSPSERRALVTTFADQRAVGMNVPADVTRGFHDVIYAVPDVDRPEARPFHPPLFATWIAVWVLARGIAGAGAAVLPWSLAYLLAVAALARRAFGPREAMAAVAIVAVGPAFAYYGRTPYAETAGGALLLAGGAVLCALARGGPRPALAGLAGLALGLAVLAKVDTALAVVALAAWWLADRRPAAGPREGAGLLVGLAPGLVHLAALASGPSGLYLGLNGGGTLALALARPGWVMGVAGVAVLALAVWRRAAPEAPLRWLAMGVVGLLALAWIGSVLAPGDRPPAMVRILGWALAPLGVWAAAVGLVRAARSGQRGARPALAMALLAVPVVLGEPAVTRSLSSAYAARRLVPYAIPVAAALAASLLPLGLGRIGLGRRPGGGGEGWWPVAATVGIAGLMGLHLGLAARPMLAHGEFGGGGHLAGRLAALGSERDVWLFASVLDGSDAGRLAAMLGNLEGRATAVVARPGRADELAPAVGRWLAEGRRVLLVADDEERLPAIAGYEAAYVDETSIVPAVLAPSPLLPPRWTPYELAVVVYELVPEGDWR